jgi:hypothetical protein
VSPTGVSGPHPVSSTPAILPGLTLPRQRTPVRIGSAQFERDRFLDFGSNARQRAALPPPRELSRLGQVLHYDARIAADHHAPGEAFVTTAPTYKQIHAVLW